MPASTFIRKNKSYVLLLNDACYLAGGRNTFEEEGNVVDDQEQADEVEFMRQLELAMAQSAAEAQAYGADGELPTFAFHTLGNHHAFVGT